MSLEKRIAAVEESLKPPVRWVTVRVYHHQDGSISSVKPNTPQSWALARGERVPGVKVILIHDPNTEEELEASMRAVFGS